MKSTRFELSNFTIEDELTLLRSMVCVAWLGVFVMVVLEIILRTFNTYHWPTLGGFSFKYNLVLTQFAATTAILTLLLIKRDWYEHTPRESMQRLGWLLNAVVIWMGINYFAVFHITGSIHGPLMPVLPLLCLLVVMLFPLKQGLYVAGFLFLGHIGILALEHDHYIMNPGPLAINKASAVLSITTLAGITLYFAIALLAGLAVRKRLDETGSALYRPSRIDPNSGLYKHDFLNLRLQSEINRSKRQNFSCSILLIELVGMNTEFNARSQQELRETIKQAGQVILKNIRLTMDTPANPILSPNIFAVLLPNTGADDCRTVHDRIVSCISKLNLANSQHLKIRASAVIIENPDTLSADKVINTAADALGDSSGELEIRGLSD